ncbi:MAG: LysE family transporter [Chitinophagaceae bacterium]
MPKLVRIFFTGMLVSFLGSLPLGTLNVAAMQISVTEGIHQAILFSLGALLAEVIYVRLSLVAMDWIRKQERLFRILEWVTLLIVVALAFFSFYAAFHPRQEKNIILSSTLPKFVLGLVMSALNPMQIPFWFGWSTVLFTKKILLPRADHYNSYIVGIGIGTFAGNSVFIFGGKLMVDRLNANQNMLNWIIGGIFGITALIQLWRMMRKKHSLTEKLDHPEQVTHGLEKKLHE